MTLEKAKLLQILISLQDALLEIQVGGDATKVREQVMGDLKNPTFQRSYLMGLERALSCDGIPAFLSGDEARIITSHINRIGLTFRISEKEKAHAQ
jgi:hypothetical protein